MQTFIILVILIAAVLLVLVVLAQDSKGGGLTAGVSSATQQMGARRTTDWIEKATWTLAGTMFALCLLAVVFIEKGDNSGGFTSPNVEKAKQEKTVDMPSSTEGTSTEETQEVKEEAGE